MLAPKKNDVTLSEENRSKLDAIVKKMVSNNESDENIRFVVKDFKSKYGSLKKKGLTTPSVPLSTPSSIGGQTGQGSTEVLQQGSFLPNTLENAFPNQVVPDSQLPENYQLGVTNTSTPSSSSLPIGEIDALLSASSNQYQTLKAQQAQESVDLTPFDFNQNNNTIGPLGTKLSRQNIEAEQQEIDRLNASRENEISQISDQGGADEATINDINKRYDDLISKSQDKIDKNQQVLSESSFSINKEVQSLAELNKEKDKDEVQKDEDVLSRLEKASTEDENYSELQRFSKNKKKMISLIGSDFANMEEEEVALMLNKRINSLDTDFQYLDFQESGATGDYITIVNKFTGDEMEFFLDNTTSEMDKDQSNKIRSYIDLQMEFPEYTYLTDKIRKMEYESMSNPDLFGIVQNEYGGISKRKEDAWEDIKSGAKYRSNPAMYNRMYEVDKQALINLNRNPEYIEAKRQLSGIIGDMSSYALKDDDTAFAFTKMKANESSMSLMFDKVELERAKYNQVVQQETYDQEMDIIMSSLDNYRDVNTGQVDFSMVPEEEKRMVFDAISSLEKDLNISNEMVSEYTDNINTKQENINKVASSAAVASEDFGTPLSDIKHAAFRGLVTLPSFINRVEATLNSDIEVITKDEMARFIGGQGVTKEYTSSEDRAFAQKVLTSLTESISTAISTAGILNSQTAFTLSSTIDALEQMDDPAFDEISDAEKWVYSGIYGVGMGALENLGFSKSLAKTPAGKTAIRAIFHKTLKDLPKNSTMETLEAELKRNARATILKGGIDIVSASLAEGGTEYTQEGLDATMKLLYNKIRNEDLFETYDSFSEFNDSAWEQALLGAAGGSMMQGTTKVLSGKASTWDVDAVKLVDQVLNRDSSKGYKEFLDTQVSNGNMSQEEADKRAKSASQAQEIFDSIPETVKGDNRYSAFSLIAEKKELEDTIKGKDRSLVSRESERIAEINQQLKSISDEDFRAKVIEGLEKDLEFERSLETGGNPENISTIESQISTLKEIGSQAQVSDEAESENQEISVTYKDGADVEYKIDDGFYKESDFIQKMNEDSFMDKVKSGEVKVEVQNPSLEVEALLTPKTVQDEVQQTQKAEDQTTQVVIPTAIDRTEGDTGLKYVPSGPSIIPTAGTNSRQKKFILNADPTTAEQALKQTMLSGVRIDKKVAQRELGISDAEINQKKTLFSSSKAGGANIVDIDGMIEVVRGNNPEFFDEMEDSDIRNMIIDTLMSNDSIGEIQKSLTNDFTVDGVMYQRREDRNGAEDFRQNKISQESFEQETFEQEVARLEGEIAEMKPEDLSVAEQEFDEYIQSLTDEEIEDQFGEFTTQIETQQSAPSKKGVTTELEQKSQKKVRNVEETTPPTSQPPLRYEDTKSPEKVSRMSKRAAEKSDDPEIKKLLNRIGKYNTKTNEGVTKYVEDLIKVLGPEGAYEYASTDPELNRMLKNAIIATSGLEIAMKGKSDLAKAQDSGNSQAEFEARERMIRGYDIMNQSALEKTISGQDIQYTRELYKKYPSMFQLALLQKFENSNSGELDTEYSEDADGNIVTARESIENLQEKLQADVDTEVSAKMDEILSRLKSTESENESLRQEIEKMKADFEKKLGTKKQKVQKAKKKRSDAIEKLRKAGKGGQASASIIGLNEEQIGAILDIVSSFVEEGVANTDIILTRTLKIVRDVTKNKGITKNHIKNIADTIDEFNAMVQMEIESGEKTAADLLRGEDLKDIVRSHYKGRHGYARTLAQSIMANTELDADTASAIASSIESELKSTIDGMVEKRLTEMLMNERATMADLKKKKMDGTISDSEMIDLNNRLKSSQNQKIEKKIIDAVNMGALSRGKDFQSAFERKFGFKNIPSSVRAKLISITDRIADLEMKAVKEITDAEGNVVDTIDASYVEQVARLQKEFNTLLESQLPVNTAIVLREIVSAQYIGMLSNPKTFGRAFIGGYSSGFLGLIAFNMRNVTNVRALGAGYKAAIKSLPAAWSRARTARKTGYDFFQDNALKGDYNASRKSRVESYLFEGLGDGINSLYDKEATTPYLKRLFHTSLKSAAQTLKVIHAIGALDAFMNTIGGSMVGATNEYKEHAKANRKNPTMNMTVTELLQKKKVREAAYDSIANEEFKDLVSDITKQVKSEAKASGKNVSESTINSRVQKRLRDELGIRGSVTSSPKRTYKTRRIQELRENAMGRYFEVGIELSKDASLMGKPDGLVGMGIEKFQVNLNIKAEDNAFVASSKFVLNSLFKFVRMTGVVINKSVNNIPVLGIANVWIGPGWDPVNKEWDTSFLGKKKANPELARQRTALNALISTMFFAVMTEMFEFGDEDEDNIERLGNIFNPKKWKLDPNRRIDVRGFGFGGMSGPRKNVQFRENWENISFSITKDADGNFTNYMNTRLSTELAAVSASIGVFSDDFKSDASEDDIYERMDSPFSSYGKKIISNNMRLFTESSFSSVGRMSKNFMMEEEFVNAFYSSVRGVFVDNTRSVVNPGSAQFITSFFTSQMQLNSPDYQDNLIADIFRGGYGLDYLISKREKTDLFGNPYPETNDINEFVYGLTEKRSDQFDKTVGLLYKFDKGLDINKWNASTFKKSKTFNYNKKEYRVTSDEIRDEIIDIQQEMFREKVLGRYEYLDSIEDRETLNKRMKKYQSQSKNKAKKTIWKKYYSKGKNNGIVLVDK